MIAGVLLLALWWQTPAAPAEKKPEAVADVQQLIRSGKLQEARQALDLMVPPTPETEHLKGVVDFRLKQYTKANEELLASAKTEAEDSVAWRESVLLLAQSLYLSARVQDAIPWLEKARRFGARQVELDYMLGNAYVQSRNAEQGVAAFARMFDVPAGSAAAHLITAQMMIRQEFEEAAEKELHRALELDPKIPQAHYMLGELATFHGRFDEGIEQLRQEIALNPDFGMAYYKLGDAYSRREQWDQAVPQLQKSIWLNPAYSGPYILLGKAYLKQGQFALAESILRRALQMDPQNATAHYLLGQSLVQQGRTAEGRQLLQRSQALRNNGAEADGAR